MTLAEAQILGNIVASHADNWFGCMDSFVDDLNTKFPEFIFELRYQQEINEFGGHFQVKVAKK